MGVLDAQVAVLEVETTVVGVAPADSVLSADPGVIFAADVDNRSAATRYRVALRS